MQVRGKPVRSFDDLCVAVAPFTLDDVLPVADRGRNGLGNGGHRELHYCSILSGEQTQNRTGEGLAVRFCVCSRHHGWWGSRRTIRPLASLSSVPSASVMLAVMKTFLPSISVMRPYAVRGSSIGVMLR